MKHKSFHYWLPMNWCWLLLSYPVPGRSVFKRFPSFEPYVAQWLISDQIFFSPVLKKTATSFFLLQFFVAFFKLCSQAWCHMSLCDRYHARKQSLPNSFCAPCNCTKCTWRKQWKGNWTSSRYRKFSNCAQNNVIEIILFSYWARPTDHELSGIDRWYTALVVSGTPTMIYQVPALAMKAACARASVNSLRKSTSDPWEGTPGTSTSLLQAPEQWEQTPWW